MSGSKLPKKRRRVLPVEAPRGPKGPKGVGGGGPGGGGPQNRRMNAIKHSHPGALDVKMGRMAMGGALENLLPFCNSTPHSLAHIMRSPTGNPVSSNNSKIPTTAPVPQTNANSHTDIVKPSDVIVRDASSVKSANSVSTEQRSTNQSPNSSPHASNNLVAVNT